MEAAELYNIMTSGTKSFVSRQEFLSCGHGGEDNNPVRGPNSGHRNQTQLSYLRN